MKLPISVTILTRNSGKTLRQCLESVAFCDDILILDGNSTDNTLEIANEFGARIFPQYETSEPNVVIKNFTELRKKSFALAKYEWVFYIDSDEYCSPELQRNIQYIVSQNNREVLGMFHREAIIGGSPITHAYFYPDWCARLFHKNSGIQWKEGPLVHESLVIPQNIQKSYCGGILYAQWSDFKVTKKKYTYYLHLSEEKFKRDIEKIRWRDFLRGACKNSLRAAYIFFRILYLHVRFAHKGILPWRYHIQFPIYHLRMAWSRKKWSLLSTRSWRGMPKLLRIFLILGLVLRLAVFFLILATQGQNGFVYNINGDAVEYVTLAKNIVAGNGYSIETQPPYTSNDFRAPGYPFFLILFGVGQGIYWPAIFLQIIFSIILVLLVYYFVKTWIGERAAFIAAGLTALEPNMWYWPNQMISESLFVFLFFCAFFLLWNCAIQKSWRFYFLGLTTLMLATYVRPVTLPLLSIIVVVAAIYVLMRMKKRRHALLILVGSVFIVAAALAPWYTRNYKTFGVFSFAPSFAARGSIGKYLTTYTEYRYAAPPQVVFDELSERGVSGARISERYGARLLQTVVADPLPFISIVSANMAPFFLGDGWNTILRTFLSGYGGEAMSIATENAVSKWQFLELRVLFSSYSWFFIVGKLVYSVLTLFMIVGAYKLLRKKTTRILGISLVCVIVYFALVSGVGSYARFRYPAEPFIFILASVAFSLSYKNNTSFV